MKWKKVFGWILSAFAFVCGIIGVAYIVTSPTIFAVMLAIFLGILEVGLVWYVFLYHGEDEGSKYRGINAVIMVLIGLMGMGILGMSHDLSNPWEWILIELGLLLLLIAFVLGVELSHYETLEGIVRHYGELEGYLRREQLAEKNILIKAMSVSDLLALKEKHKSNESVVEIIDDILEERE